MNATLLHLLLTIPPIFAPKKLNLGNLLVSLSASTIWYPATVAWALSNLCHGTRRSCLALLCVRWALFQQSLGFEGLALQLRANAGKHRLSNTHDKMGYNMMWAVPSKANIILRTETVFPKQVEKLAMARTSSASSSFNPIGKNQCLKQVFSTRKVQKIRKQCRLSGHSGKQVRKNHKIIGWHAKKYIQKNLEIRGIWHSKVHLEPRQATRRSRRDRGSPQTRRHKYHESRHRVALMATTNPSNVEPKPAAEKGLTVPLVD